MREKDAITAWTNASDCTLEERVYYVQNWRSDVMAILDSDGNPLERMRYTAYGTPSSHPIADIDGNGTVEAADQTQWAALLAGGTNSAVYAQPDLNADGLFPDQTDEDFFAGQYARVGAGSVFGVNKLSSVASRKGYAGYEWDASLTSWYRRNAAYDAASGKSVRAGGSVIPFVPTERWRSCVNSSLTWQTCLDCCVSGNPTRSEHSCAIACGELHPVSTEPRPPTLRVRCVKIPGLPASHCWIEYAVDGEPLSTCSGHPTCQFPLQKPCEAQFPWGPIRTYCGPADDPFNPDYGIDPERPDIEIPITLLNCEAGFDYKKAVACMRRTQEKISRCAITYHPTRGPNSNTVVRFLLENCFSGCKLFLSRDGVPRTIGGDPIGWDSREGMEKLQECVNG
jgi:hypothetical protein